MTPATLDQLAEGAGGYTAAVMRELDIADTYRGLGDPETDAMYQHHAAVALALQVRCTQRFTPRTDR